MHVVTNFVGRNIAFVAKRRVGGNYTIIMFSFTSVNNAKSIICLYEYCTLIMVVSQENGTCRKIVSRALPGHQLLLSVCQQCFRSSAMHVSGNSIK